MDSTKEYIIKHKLNVQTRLLKLCNLLLKRSENHDESKLQEPELSGWVKIDQEPRYKYGTPEYFDKKERFKYLFEQHYKDNRNTHHPEHFGEQGILGMDLLDLIEFLCDCFAYSSEDITYTEALNVIEQQIKRFKISEDLGWALKNTVQNYFCKFGGKLNSNEEIDLTELNKKYSRELNFSDLII